MAEALCGPSNALQQFQKHTSVDRTLQQDRLVGRGSPAQAFRSSPGPAAGAVDSEFEAFQAGHTGLLQPDVRPHPPAQFARPQLPPQFTHPQAHAPQGSDWASDFQRLTLSHTSPIQQQQHHAPIANAASSWHQDFMAQQAPVAQAPTFQQQNGFGGMGGYGYQRGNAFAGMNGAVGMGANGISQVAQGKQRAQDQAPQFDEAAFEKAFAQVDQNIVEETTGLVSEGRQTALDGQQNHASGDYQAILPGLEEENKATIYAASQLRSAIDMGNHLEATLHFQHLETLEQTNRLTQNPSEARLVIDVLQKISNRAGPELQEMKVKADTLTRAINERLMSTYPLLSTRTQMTLNVDNEWEELEVAGYTRSPVPERVLEPQQPEPMQEEAKPEQQPTNDNDEMAQTAGQLLERVADNTSEKFQNSQFLDLMRRLRDREVRVEGDKMVEVSDNVPPPTSMSIPAIFSTQQQTQTVFNQEAQGLFSPPNAATVIPDIDPEILNHAATDFNIPVYDQHQEYAEPFPSEASRSFFPRRSTKDPLTDEISDQFRYYNVNAAYHK
ncbi:hypothetical protein CC80DRAFT_424639 [Byssothecium circinans]|uniref:Peroxin 20 n=1 Tax=Byssothecium circinans TaxID=147558 RepID=A0A6A5TH48_9PLEO|nr:hypothetical protein CC80DRAFT_424639 [Byssothecium circinans]